LQRSRIAAKAVAVGVEAAEQIVRRDRRDSRALLAAERERIVPRPGRAARADVAARGVVAADLGAAAPAQRALAAAGEDLHDAADRVRTVQARRRSAQDLDVVDVREAQCLE